MACADHLTAPRPATPGGAAGLLRIQCTADVRSLAVACPPGDSAQARASGSAKGPAGVSADIMLGGQHTYITLASSNVTYANSVFGFDATVENLVPQPLGTTDGTTISPNGIRVFFASPPATTGGTGTVDYTDPTDNTTQMVDGFATFTASNQAYYQYDTLLTQNQTALAKHWRLHVPASVTSFSFTVYVDAPVQFPNGWIDVSPTPDTIAPNGNATLTGTVRDYVGRTVTGQTLTWSSNATAVATVGSSTGIVSAVNPGTATISVTNGTVSGSATFVTRDTPPIMVAQSLSYPGNVGITVDSAHGFMAGLTDPDAGQNHTLTAPTGTTTLTSGATLTVNTNGSFTYTPAAGQTGTDSIPYTVSDGILTATSYAKVALAGGMHWYVDNTASGTGANGTKAHPFTTLAGLSGKTSANDTIMVNAGSGAYSGALTLLSGETLLGQAALASNLTVTLNGATVTLFATGGTPHLSLGAAGSAITLGTNNTIKGLSITATSGAGISGTSFGTLTLAADTVLATGGASLSLTTGSIASGSSILFAKSTSSMDDGILLNAVSGSLTISRDSVVSPAAAGLLLVNGSVSLTTSAGGIVTTTGGGRPVDIESNTGAIVSLGENITANATTQNGLFFSANTGATITLSGNMAVSTGANAAFAASGGGTINVTGTSNTLTTTTGTALSVQNTVIGASGLAFQSISSNGATNGILLSSTGSSGGLTVTGGGASDPANATHGRTTAKLGGGSITLGSGGTIQNSTGVGVKLSSTNNVVLRNLTVSNGGGTSVGSAGSGNDAIQAVTVSGLTLDNVLVSGDTANMGLYGSGVSGLYLVHADIENNANLGNATNAGTQNTNGIWNVRLDNLAGLDSVWDSYFQHATVNLFGVNQSSLATAATFKVYNSEFDNLASANYGTAGLYFEHNASGLETISVTSSIFTGITGGASSKTAVLYTGNTSDGGGTLTIAGNTMDGNNAEIYVGFEGTSYLIYQDGDYSVLTATIANNSFRQTRSGSGNALDFEILSGSVWWTVMNAIIRQNVIGTASVPGSTGASGIQLGGLGGGTLAATLDTNTVLNVTGGDGVIAQAGGTSQFNLRFRGNDIESSAGYGVELDAGLLSGDAPTACFDLAGNKKWVGNSTLSGITVLNLNGNPTVNLYGYSGPFVNYLSGPTQYAALESFLNGTATTVSPSAAGQTDVQGGVVEAGPYSCYPLPYLPSMRRGGTLPSR